jgi:hypothetical protein
MGYADIPLPVKEKLASERMRMYHALWHFVRRRDAWEGLEPGEREELARQGWTPPRFEREPGGGIDFLYMHRQMIGMVNEWASAAAPHEHHLAQPFVVGWLDIPWDHEDPVWPMPVVDLTSDPQFPRIFGRAKDPAVTEFYRRRVAEEFGNRAWLRAVSLDQFATALEFSIHGWMHLHWSPAPPPNPNSLDPTNDWLGSPFSSHVNKHFWKLHGWIDDRIKAWEDANGEIADLSEGWEGPPDYVTGEMHSADPQLFRTLQFEERPPLLMPWKDLLLEGQP